MTYRTARISNDMADVAEVDSGARHVHDLADQTLEKLGGGIAQQLGSDDGKNRTDDGQDQGDDKRDAVRFQVSQKGASWYP